MKVLKLTDSLMPLENSYYNDLASKMQNIEVKQIDIEPFEVKFDEELFEKSKQSQINCFTEDICKKLDLSLDLFKKRQPTQNKDNKRTYEQTEQKFHYVPKKI